MPGAGHPLQRDDVRSLCIDVEKALNGTSGVHHATVSCVNNTAQIVHDSAMDVEDLVAAVEDIGFGAEIAWIQQRDQLNSVVHVELKVRGMTCSACSGTVERVLAALPGVTRAAVYGKLREGFCLTLLPDVPWFFRAW